VSVETPDVEMSDEEAEKMWHIIDNDDATERVRTAASRSSRQSATLTPESRATIHRCRRSFSWR